MNDDGNTGSYLTALERSAKRERLALFLLALNTLFLLIVLALQLRGPRVVPTQRF